MKQLTRDELIKLYDTLEGQNIVLDQRILDIKYRQRDILNRQLDIRDTIYNLDASSGQSTCPTCFALLSKEAQICGKCGEEQ